MSTASSVPTRDGAHRPDHPQPMLPANLRDLGGLALEDGTRTRTRVALRSDDLTRADRVTATDLVSRYGIGDVIDLRNHTELARLGRAATYELPVRHHHLPISLDVGTTRGRVCLALPTTPQELGRLYARTVERAALPLRFAVEVVAEARAAVVFHSVAGKDRAGLLAALLLTAVGVEPDAILDDYTRTSENLPSLRASVLGPDAGVGGAIEGPPIDVLPAMMLSAPREAMRVCLTTLTVEHGSPLGPLVDVGLRPQTLELLRERLVETR